MQRYLALIPRQPSRVRLDTALHGAVHAAEDSA